MFTRPIVASAAFFAMSSAAFAGGLAEPVMEQDIIVETVAANPGSASANTPIIIFALLVAVASRT